jgi:hypothetical protein
MQSSRNLWVWRPLKGLETLLVSEPGPFSAFFLFPNIFELSSAPLPLLAGPAAACWLLDSCCWALRQLALACCCLLWLPVVGARASPLHVFVNDDATTSFVTTTTSFVVHRRLRLLTRPLLLSWPRQAPASTMAAAAAAVFPIGTPGKAWGDAEKQEWRATRQVQRSYKEEVLDKLALLDLDVYDVVQYGHLEQVRR